MSDLVERLRAEAALYGVPTTDSVLELEAANEITRLRAEVGALRADAERWQLLSDPATLHANLLRGIPARLTREQLVHLLGSEDPMAKDADRWRKLRETFTNPSLGDIDAAIDAARKNNDLPT